MAAIDALETIGALQSVQNLLPRDCMLGRGPQATSLQSVEMRAEWRQLAGLHLVLIDLFEQLLRLQANDLDSAALL